MAIDIPKDVLSRPARLRRTVGAALTDWFFYGGAQGVRALGLGHPRLHGAEVVKDVPYFEGGRYPHRLDVYRPRGVQGPTPIIFYVHGGAFRFMSKDTHWLFGLRFAAAGYTVFSINYRLAPKHPYPAAIEDVCRAYDWVVKNAHAHGGDVSRLALAGESAGANLVTALTLALTTERPEPYAKAVYDLGVLPKAVLPACGFLQLTQPERFPLSGLTRAFFEDRLRETTEAYLGGLSFEHPHQLDLADPLVALDRDEPTARPLPPFFIPCGDSDVLKHDSLRLQAALERRGIDAEAKLYPGGMHAFHAFVFTRQARACWHDMREFLRATL